MHTFWRFPCNMDSEPNWRCLELVQALLGNFSAQKLSASSGRGMLANKLLQRSLPTLFEVQDHVLPNGVRPLQSVYLLGML